MKSQTIWKNLPKVGIRPTIDGRLGGVRESLEEQTMKQATSGGFSDSGYPEIPQW